MSDDEVRAFLGDSLKVQVASIGSKGMPHLTTLFYVLLDEDAEDAPPLIAFWTYGSSQKIKNLERDPRISCLVETGVDYFELAGVSIQGTAELVRDKDRIRAIGSKVVAAMSHVGSLEELGDLGRDIVEKQVQKRVAVVVTPNKVASWDHRKMTALPGAGSGGEQ